MNHKAHVKIWTSALARVHMTDPYAHVVWPGLTSPVIMLEVYDALDNWQPPKARCGQTRKAHIQQIAGFVLIDWDDLDRPIELDVGVPELRYSRTYFVDDGNHRLASALFRLRMLGEDRQLYCEVSGSVKYAHQLEFL